jgi:hypothetical protein
MRERAERLAELLPHYPRGMSRVNGSRFWIIPAGSRPAAYYSSHLGCSCPGFQHRGVCAHQLACLLVVQRSEASQTAASNSGPCVGHGCTAQATGKSRRCDRHFAELIERPGI